MKRLTTLAVLVGALFMIRCMPKTPPSSRY